MLKHAMLAEYLGTAFDILIRHQLASEDDRREPELVDIPVNTRLGPAHARLYGNGLLRPSHQRELLGNVPPPRGQPDTRPTTLATTSTG